MEKVESLEQAAREFIRTNQPEPLKCIYCAKPQSTQVSAAPGIWESCPAGPVRGEGHTYEFQTGGYEDYELKRLVNFAAERERQVWAEAAKIVVNWSNNLCDEARTGPQSVVILTGPTKDTLSLRDETKEYASGLLANVYAVLRARGEQVK